MGCGLFIFEIMPTKTHKLKLTSKKQFELIDITELVDGLVTKSGVRNGLVNIFSPHTTASVRLNQNEPLLIQDIMKTIYDLVPVDINYSHDLFEIRSGIEALNRSNGHAHVKNFLMGSSQTIPLEGNKMTLTARQSIFFVELDGGREREVIVTVIGD